MNINFCDTDEKQYVELVRTMLSDTQRYAYVQTFGCQQNEADSEKLRGMATLMGYLLTDKPECADLILINTCAIRKHAEMKALSELGHFKALKKKKPSLIIGVCGCMVAEEHIVDLIKKDFHYISFTLEPSLIHKLPSLVYRFLLENKRSFIFRADEGNIVEGIKSVRQEKHRAWVSIMYGCNNFCSYCIVPYVRGRERSRNSADVIRECSQLVTDGYREITLLGQNVNSYKSDIDFPTLLSKIAELEGDFIIRFMTSHPKDVSDSLIEVMGKYRGKIAPYFHLPLQSGSDRILKAMNRTYDVNKFLDTVEKLRRAVPDIALSTDVIVGFPDESEEDFLSTLDVLRTARFDMAYSFIYSLREGTRAEKMPNHVSEEVKGERMTRLLDIQTNISQEKNLEYVGRVERVLVDAKSKRGEDNVYTARTASNKLVHFKSDTDVIGKFKLVKITKAGAFDLFGELIERE